MSKRKKLERLTPEQEAARIAHHAEWLRIGTSTERADRPRAEAAIKRMYQLVGEPEPAFLWCDSPATCVLGLNFLRALAKEDSSLESSLYSSLRSSLESSLESSLGSSLRSSLWSSLRSSLWSSLESSLGSSLNSSLWSSLGSSLNSSLGSSLGSSLESSLWSSLWSSLESSLGSSLGSSLWSSLESSLGSSLRSDLSACWWGQHEGAWIAFYLYPKLHLGVSYEPERAEQLGLWSEVAQSCCWWWPYKSLVVCSERPTVVNVEAVPGREDTRRLHCATGPALAFADGWSVHAWHGTTVPAEWIANPKALEPTTALSWPNVEQRRAAAEIVGWTRILEAVNARTVDKDADPMIGELLEADLPDAPKQKFLRVRCGTGRDFCLPVPPDMRTALQANGWTYDVQGPELEQFRNYAART